MKFKRNERDDRVPVGDLSTGDAFEWGREVWVVINLHFNVGSNKEGVFAINLDHELVEWFGVDGTTLVKPLNEVIITTNVIYPKHD